MRVTVQRWGRALSHPLQTHRGLIAERAGFQVRLLDDDGIEGRGEAAPLLPFTESLEACEAALAAVKSLAASVKTLGELDDWLAPWNETPAARHALECAWLEVFARREKIPVARLLNADARGEVQVSALMHSEDPDALVREAMAAVAAGYSCLKIKVGAASAPVDTQRLLDVRRSVGPTIRLRIDANGAWSEEMARASLSGWSALKIEVCEQPVAADAYEAMGRLRGSVSCALALDEGLLTLEGRTWTRGRAPRDVADVWVLKPMALGGLLPAVRLARKAAALGVGTYVTTLIDGRWATAAALHLACAIGPSQWAHGLATLPELEGEVVEPLKPSDGRLMLPLNPGWGI